MVQRITKVGTRPQAGAKIKIVTGPKKDTNEIELNSDQTKVYDPNKEGETRRINTTTGYFGTKICSHCFRSEQTLTLISWVE